MNVEKWIIAFKMPSGSRYAFSEYNKTFALVPMSDHGTVRGAHVWKTETEARTYYDQVRAQMLEKGMKPFDELGQVEFMLMMEPH